MAEISLDGDHSEVQEDAKMKVEVDPDSGEGEDYSSGSDRSLEDADAAHDEPGLVKSQISTDVGLAERRKKRHGSHGSRRHKGGSRHKNRGFHPYLDPAEEMQLKRKSQELKEKENAAAVVRQEGESRFMNFPVAPFNSTQFLMDEHDSGSPAGMQRTTSSSNLGDDFPMLHSVASTPAENQKDMVNYERKDKEFTDIYATVHAESLQSLPKEELVKNYMSLEEKVAALQKKVAEAEQMKRQNDDSGETQVPDAGDDTISGCGTQIPASDSVNSTDHSGTGIEMSAASGIRPTISVGDSGGPSAAMTCSSGGSS